MKHFLQINETLFTKSMLMPFKHFLHALAHLFFKFQVLSWIYWSQRGDISGMTHAKQHIYHYFPPGEIYYLVIQFWRTGGRSVNKVYVYVMFMYVDCTSNWTALKINSTSLSNVWLFDAWLIGFDILEFLIMSEAGRCEELSWLLT